MGMNPETLVVILSLIAALFGGGIFLIALQSFLLKGVNAMLDAKIERLSDNLGHNLKEIQDIVAENQDTLSDNQRTLADNQRTLAENKKALAENKTHIDSIQSRQNKITEIITATLGKNT